MMNLKKKYSKITGPLRSYYNYFYGEEEIKFLFKYFKNYKGNYIFVDIGANYGIYTFLFYKNSAYTYAIEPISTCLEYIKKGFLNKKNIEFINKIASNKNGETVLKTPIENGLPIYGKSSVVNNFNNYENIICKTFIMDKYFDEIDSKKHEIIFIKIDVEGHELEVLQGAAKIISNKKSLLLVEIEKRHNKKYIEVFKYLIHTGFSVDRLKNGNLQSVAEEEVQNIMLVANNFVFKNY